MRDRTRAHGFTLVEVLLASAIAALMLIFINRMFGDATAAVSRGAATSDVIATARAVRDQIQKDFAAMLGPGLATADEPHGFLVIVHKRVVPNPSSAPEFGYAPAVRQGYGRQIETSFKDYRLDQLLFIRKVEEANSSQTLRSLAPRSKVDLEGFDSDAGGHARVWYGHGRRTLPDGTDSLDLTVTVPGVTPIDQTTYGSRNRVASDWVLARHAMILAGDAGVTFGAGDVYVEETPAVVAVPVAPPDSIIGGYNNDVVGYPGFVAPFAPAWRGLSDVAEVSLQEITDELGTRNPPQLPPNNKPLASEYRWESLLYMYLRERLRVSPEPLAGAGSNMAEKVARMHTAFGEHISNFQIDFAADTDADGQMDTWESLRDATGPTLPASVPVTDPMRFREGIIWYGMDADGNAVRNPTPLAGAAPLPVGAYSYHFEDDADPTTNFYPDLKDEPFHLVSPTSPDTKDIVIRDNADMVWVFRHDATPVPGTNRTVWPMLIRVRFRVHDANGRIADPLDGLPGRVFEVIVPVNRQ